MSESPPLPLARLLLVGMLVPAVFSALDHWMLTRLQLNASDRAHLVLTMAVFVVQIGLLGWLCGRLIENPWWRWGLYVWGWVLVDVQLLAASVFAQGRGYWDQSRLLPASLFAAQVSLALIWAILGTTPWPIRLPLCAVVGLFLSAPLLESPGFIRDLFPVQMISLAALCLLLRWRGFSLQRIERSPARAEPSVQKKQLLAAQFSIRHVLIWTTSLALVLGVLRALDLLSLAALRTFFEYDVIAVLTAGILISAVFVIAVWAALGAGSVWLRLAVLFLAMPPMGALLAVLNWYSFSKRISGRGTIELAMLWTDSWVWQNFLDNYSALALWVYLAGSLLFASLLILRVLGYRLVRSAKPRPVVGVQGS
jgi:hypothetical protein